MARPASTLRLPGEPVTVYPVIGLAPANEGVQLTRAEPAPGIPTTLVGGAGTPFGVTLADAEEAGPLPMASIAVTVNVYWLPLVRPVMTALVCVPGALMVAPPGEAVTV